ncbi:MAG TPA: cytochrome C [Anaeromyxobacteraceae bacterium]|nr:cytochrome C [Anaeromyxobacteraceae bacterium]
MTGRAVAIALVIAAATRGASAAEASPAAPRARARVAPAAGDAPDERRAPPDLRPPPSHGNDTRCGLCHVPDGWDKVSFAHDRTGFPLRDRHAQTACKSCHATTFDARIPMICSGCHRDVHRGEFGALCASCHGAASWATSFTADAHRRTSFPLSGRHAFIPCEECHRDRRDRTFSRATVQCISCHQADYDRTALVSVDHAASGFSQNCRECHTPWRFTGAFFPAHDQCFQISRGPHAKIRCLDCHVSLTGATISTCSTAVTKCTSCHGCAQHPSVAGFACQEQKCYECHRFSSSGALRATRRTR